MSARAQEPRVQSSPRTGQMEESTRSRAREGAGLQQAGRHGAPGRKPGDARRASV